MNQDNVEWDSSMVNRPATRLNILNAFVKSPELFFRHDFFSYNDDDDDDEDNGKGKLNSVCR